MPYSIAATPASGQPLSNQHRSIHTAIANAINAMSSSNQLGVTIPDGWGQHSRARIDADEQLRVVVLGESIARGQFATTLDNGSTGGWVAQMRDYLQTTYGDGGGGFMHIFDTYATHSNNYSSEVGTIGANWDLDDFWAYATGPEGRWVSTLTLNAECTGYKVRGTSVSVVVLGGDVEVRIDAGSWQSTSGIAGSIATYTWSSLSDTTHTVDVRCKVADTKVYVWGFIGSKSGGVIVHNMSLPGATTWAPAQYEAPTWEGGAALRADMLIIELGGNDMNDANNTTAEGMAVNLRTMIDSILNDTGVNGAIDMMFVLPMLGPYSDSETDWHLYRARLLDLASLYGAAVVDLWPISRASWNYWVTSGYASNGSAGTTNTTPATADVHPSDDGHALIASKVLGVLATVGI